MALVVVFLGGFEKIEVEREAFNLRAVLVAGFFLLAGAVLVAFFRLETEIEDFLRLRPSYFFGGILSHDSNIVSNLSVCLLRVVRVDEDAERKKKSSV